MCRLLGYATAGFNLSLNAVLGQDNVEDFRELSEIHNDGWGVAQLSDPAEAPHVRDGGAPTPETGTRIYKSTIAARHDSTFEALADEPSRGAIWHLRLASSNLPLIMENQHPFYANGLSFIHNGDISDANGRNIVTNRSYPVNHSVFLSTGGRSDSAIFFSVILEYIAFGFALDEAVAQAEASCAAGDPARASETLRAAAAQAGDYAAYDTLDTALVVDFSNGNAGNHRSNKRASTSTRIGYITKAQSPFFFPFSFLIATFHILFGHPIKWYWLEIYVLKLF